jgi:manganese oxidase
MGMYGAFIIEARDEDLTIYDQDVTWMLSSFNTKKHIHNEGVSKYFSGNHQYKVEKDAFLINGKAFPSTKALTVKEGDLVKLRLIHMGKEPYSMHLHGHSFTTTHKDGFKIENPQEMDTLPILPGERYDLKIEMKNPGAWVFHDHITQHVTNDGFYPGGMLSLILYEGYDLPEHLTDLLTKIDNYKIETLKLGQPVETAKVQETKAHDDGDGHGH